MSQPVTFPWRGPPVSGLHSNISFSRSVRITFFVRPPQSSLELGGPESELLALYNKRSEYHKVSDSIYVSDVELSLSEYIKGRQLYCLECHKTPCTKCESMLRVAQTVHTAGYCSCLMLLKLSPLESSTWLRKLEDYSSKFHLFQFVLAIQPKATHS